MEECFRGMDGAFAATYTPFKPDGSLNEEMLERLVEYGLANGLRGFYLTGSTGEGFLLSGDERERVYRRVVQTVRGRAKVIAHVGCFSTADACDLARRAAKAGVDWVSSVAPVYFGQDFEAAYRHYRLISEATDLPFMVYSVGKGIVPSRDARLFDLRNVKGMKYTGYAYWTVQALAGRVQKEAVFFAGADEQVLSALACKGLFAGCIGTSQNTLPAHFARICALAREGRFLEAGDLQREVVRFVELITARPNASWHKALPGFVGLECGAARSPAGEPLTPEERKELERGVEALGFIGKA